MQTWTTTVYANLSPETDASGRVVRFAERQNGDPTSEDPCPRRFVITPLLNDRGACARAASRGAPHRGQVLRIFVELRFRQAQVVNCTRLTHLDERAVRNHEPAAVAAVRALRDAGADVLLIRGEHTRHVGVVFVDAIGSTIVIADEAPHTLVDGQWRRASPGRDRRGVRRWTIGSTPRRLGLLIAWQLLVALAVGGVINSAANVVAYVSGLRIVVPVWLILALSLVIAIFVGLRLRVHFRRWRRFVTEIVSTASRMSLIQEGRKDELKGMRDEADFWRDSAQAEIDLKLEDDDDDDPSPDDGEPEQGSVIR